MRTIDLNCDLGESYGAWRMGADEAVLPFVSSASVACGFHAGDGPTMRRTVRACAKHGVALGAHVSYPDLQGFGRRSMQLDPRELEDLVLQQLGALSAFARAEGVPLRHVKAHGALYNDAARDPVRARAIVAAVRAFDPALAVYALAGSVMIDLIRDAGMAAVGEAFADRRYRADGSLVPRGTPGAVVETPAQAAAQLRALLEGTVETLEGARLAIDARTLCVHGDRDDAEAYARALHAAVREAGWTLAAPA